MIIRLSDTVRTHRHSTACTATTRFSLSTMRDTCNDTLLKAEVCIRDTGSLSGIKLLLQHAQLPRQLADWFSAGSTRGTKQDLRRFCKRSSLKQLSASFVQ